MKKKNLKNNNGVMLCAGIGMILGWNFDNAGFGLVLGAAFGLILVSFVNKNIEDK